MAGVSDWDLFLIVWYPHSGCRWLNRGLLSRHKSIAMSEYFTPWLHHSTDDLLKIDKTTQVHRSRSLPEFSREFDIVQRSVNYGREQGMLKYFSDKKDLMDEVYPDHKQGGVLPVGSEISFPDFAMLQSIMPAIRIVHMVRDPYDCFLSLKSRQELNGDPYQIGATWLGLNAWVRGYFENLGDPTRYHMIRYEDLVENTVTELERLCDWIDVPYDPGMEQGLSEYHGRNQGIDLGDLTTVKEREMLMSVTGAEAERYGYGS